MTVATSRLPACLRVFTFYGAKPILAFSFTVNLKTERERREHQLFNRRPEPQDTTCP